MMIAKKTAATPGGDGSCRSVGRSSGRKRNRIHCGDVPAHVDSVRDGTLGVALLLHRTALPRQNRDGDGGEARRVESNARQKTFVQVFSDLNLFLKTVPRADRPQWEERNTS